MEPLQLHNITLLIAMEEPPFGQYLLEYIEEKKRFAHIKRCQGAQELLRASASYDQTMVFLDASLSDFKSMNEIASFTQQLNAKHIVLFFYPVHIPHIQPLVKQNLLGYINKTNECHIIKSFIKAVMQGITSTDSSIITYYVNNTAQTTSAPQIKFTEKKLEIINFMQQGIKRSKMLPLLNIKLSTYKDHHETMTSKVREAGYRNLKDYLQRTYFQSPSSHT